MNIVIGIFFILHGLVHLLYFGQSRKYFEVKPGLTWPDGSRAFSHLIGDKAAGIAAGICCVLAAIGFVAGGIGALAAQTWWEAVTVASAVFSALIFIFFWDGKFSGLSEKGLFAILINLVILAVLFITGL